MAAQIELVDEVKNTESEDRFIDAVKNFARELHRRDKKNDELKEFISYVRESKKYGKIKYLKEKFLDIYSANRNDILDQFDDWLIDADIEIRLSDKICMPLSTIYKSQSDDEKDILLLGFYEILHNIVEDPEDSLIIHKVFRQDNIVESSSGGSGSLGDIIASVINAAQNSIAKNKNNNGDLASSIRSVVDDLSRNNDVKKLIGTVQQNM